jgi:hypothetical protein
LIISLHQKRNEKQHAKDQEWNKVFKKTTTLGIDVYDPLAAVLISWLIKSKAVSKKVPSIKQYWQRHLILSAQCRRVLIEENEIKIGDKILL